MRDAASLWVTKYKLYWHLELDNIIFLPSIQSFVQNFEIGIKRNILVTWSYRIRQFMQPLPHNWEFLDLNFILTLLWAITWNADFYQLRFEHPLTSGIVKRIECLLIEKKIGLIFRLKSVLRNRFSITSFCHSDLITSTVKFTFVL